MTIIPDLRYFLEVLAQAWHQYGLFLFTEIETVCIAILISQLLTIPSFCKLIFRLFQELHKLHLVYAPTGATCAVCSGFSTSTGERRARH